MLAATVAVLLAVSSHAEAGFCCPKTLGQTDNARQIFLDFHNDIRRNIALGKSLVNFTTNPVVLGPAQNMYKLDWDCDLEQKAAQQIAPCTVPLPIDPSLAQNIARWLYYGDSAKEEVLRQTPWSWVTPSLRFMNGTALDRFAVQWAEPLANIANWKNRKVGCAYKICPAQNNMVVSCVYGSQKLSPNEVIWEKGNTCECNSYPDSFCCDSLCDTRGASSLRHQCC
ncbi:SCP-like protein [Teladorsagia circumcincta]|uniref:SCP-like protein n=1 Tax=Teladorsagia circumcincta TaxID=45464 RepID=A0A2G9TDR7_TELCI|nr:SCP-like protein [Teladorsagia circumcincta]